jgi:oxygen-independent coproporphyrinogen-3 oxidase
MAGLYIHIPFCKQACHYCDFHFSTSTSNQSQLVDAIAKELRMQKKYLAGESLETIYFGGGTPSLLREEELKKILETIHLNFTVVEGAEVTLEANPDDLSQENLAFMRSAGLNRLSIGIQSFEDEILGFLNRVHSSEDATACLTRARKAGFDNISVDLIYAIPNQNDEQWKRNIDRVIELSPEHISAYSLTIEEKTVFGNWIRKGRFKSESDEVAAVQMEILMESLSTAGYEHYEISNFSKPNFYSRHNSSYWRQKKYLGVGPSAHSYNGESRQYNVKNNSLYIRSIGEGKIPFEFEKLTRANHINEYLLTTLRTSWGTDLGYLIDHFNFDLQHEREKELEEFQKLGLVERRENHLVLTQRGKLLADQIAADFFVE